MWGCCSMSWLSWSLLSARLTPHMGLGVLMWPLVSWVLCQVLEELKACRGACWDLAPEWKGGGSSRVGAVPEQGPQADGTGSGLSKVRVDSRELWYGVHCELWCLPLLPVSWLSRAGWAGACTRRQCFLG